MSSSPSRPKVLTAAFVRSISRPGRYGDGRGGHGLSLLVKQTANGRWSKTWAQRLRISGRTVSLGLGSYPAVSLALARERALANRQAVEEGRDPRRRHAVTFAEAMEAVVELHRPNWKPTSNTEQQWRSLLAHHIDPTIGPMPIADVSAADVVAVLDRVWDRPELARRTARRISTTMKWAMGRGLRETDPTSAAVAAMPKLHHRPNHHRALHHRDLPDALNKVRASEAAASTKGALELLVLTATRPGEVRNATWDEFDLDAAVWTIPAVRYKTGTEFRVPLSPRAVELLTQARCGTDDDALVFLSPVTGRAVSENTYVKLLRDLDIPTSAHGLRATFRSWCSDTGVPRDLAEMALGHAVSGVEGAYARSDMLERRRPLMQQWAAYIT
ncbi:MAG: tyrosine-type recombinase/integrase [Acidimicrobiaceae bacterium]|nr:tyrosine-type recombinase/integrase [Acidimicrobiaceae bacterium]